MRHWLLLSIGFSLLLPSLASAESVLGFCSPNGVRVSSDIFKIGFDGAAPDPADFVIPPPSDIFQVAPAGPTSGTANASGNILPAGGGGPKDKVEGSLTSSFEFGIPFGATGQDTLFLDASGFGSAVASFNTTGNPSDAVVEGEARAEFFIDIVPGRDCDTFLNMQEVRLLEPHETLLEIVVIRDPAGVGDLLATLVPGSPATTVLLPESNSFLIQLKYDYRVPFGVDPTFGFRYAITVGESPAVPGLGMEAAIVVGLLLLGLGTVLLRVRRATAL